jgi:hypothetical protein
VKVGAKVRGKDGAKVETQEEKKKVRRADNIGMDFQKEDKREREGDPHMVHVGVVVEITKYQIAQIKEKEKVKAYGRSMDIFKGVEVRGARTIGAIAGTCRRYHHLSS